MSVLSSYHWPGALLSGDERKALRDAILEGTDRARLRIALSDADPSRDFGSIVSESTYEDQVHRLIRLSERQGWLVDFIDIFTGMTERDDLLSVARDIRGRAEARQSSSRFPLPPLPRNPWPVAAGVAVALSVAIWLWFWVANEPTEPGSANFVVRLVDDAEPLANQSVAIWKMLGDGSAGDRLEGVTDMGGEAFFAVTYNAFYRGEARVQAGGASRNCAFPAFTPTAVERDFVQNVRAENCPGETVPDVIAFRAVTKDDFENTRGISIGPGDFPGPLDVDPIARSLRAPLGLPEAPVALDRLYYTLGFDPEIRLARWAAFTIDANDTAQVRRERVRWRFDPDLPDEAQTGELAYQQNIYDRGQIVRRSDAYLSDLMPNLDQLNQELYYYSITIPQPSTTNRRTWLAVENLGVALSEELGAIYTVAGPVFPDFDAPNVPILVIGPDRTPVPTAIFRVHLRKSPAGAWRSVAFLVPNDGSQEENPQVFLTSVAEVEKATGLEFFPEMRDDVAQKVKANADLDLFRTN